MKSPPPRLAPIIISSSCGNCNFSNLEFSNLLITRTKSRFLEFFSRFQLELPEFLNHVYFISLEQLKVRKIGNIFHCNKMARSFYNDNNRQHVLLGCREYYKRVQMCLNMWNHYRSGKSVDVRGGLIFMVKALFLHLLTLVSPSHIRSFIIYTFLFFHSAHSFIRSSSNHSFTQSFVYSLIRSFACSVPFTRFCPTFIPNRTFWSSHSSYFAVKSVVPKYAWRAKPNVPPKSQRKVRFTIPKFSQVSS